MPPAKGAPASRGLELDRSAALLALWGALLWAAEHDVPSQLGPDEWEGFVRLLAPREIIVIALHVVRGLTMQEVGDWLDVSRGRVEQHKRKAERKLAESLTESPERFLL